MIIANSISVKQKNRYTTGTAIIKVVFSMCPYEYLNHMTELLGKIRTFSTKPSQYLKPALFKTGTIIFIFSTAFILLPAACNSESKTETFDAVSVSAEETAVLAERAAARSALKEVKTGGFDDEVRSEDLQETVDFLASDALRGREIGTEGIKAAEEYIARRFKAAGLKPLPGEKDYFLEFTVYEWGFDPEESRFVIESAQGESGSRNTPQAGPGPLFAQLGVDFYPFFFSKEATVETEMVFAGYGITAPEYDYDDYTDLDVEGKIVFILRHEPNENDPESLFDGTEFSDHATFISKAENAYRHGAVGMVLVTDPLHHEKTDDLRGLRRATLSPGEEPRAFSGRVDIAEDFPAIHISQSFAARITADWPMKLSDIQRALDDFRKPVNFDLESENVNLSVKRLDEPRTIEARNIAGYLPLAPAEPERNWVLLGAHHDHLGAFPAETDGIYNGADDNASGVSAVLEMADYFAGKDESRAAVGNETGSGDSAVKTPGGIVFMTFSAEETGLLGSRATLEKNFINPDDLDLMINFDMIGRNPERPLSVGYTDVELEETFSDVSSGLRINSRRIIGSRESVSDHTPFEKMGVSSIFFFSGLHEDYHGLKDHAAKLHYERMKDVVDYAIRLIEID